MNDNHDITRFNLTEVHQDLVNLVKQVVSGESVILQHNGKNVAALISLKDLYLLERLIEEEEDRIDIAESQKIMAAVEKEGTVSWESIKTELGLS
ncbi:type II toxin-antitoxin system prevent-host-death family antitoxin [Coleofasciculus sp. H7-2]|uniref:type II toxin-antitoxin system prevent-host-death family antitoxin n=1 Tax=Coleofasciculus sp. H7-2 TaxID=3351545 RepID=UPI00366C38B2